MGEHQRLPQLDYSVRMDVYPPNIKTHYASTARDYLEKTPPEKNVWIFKSVRNTYARATSYFFQQLCSHGQDEACKKALTLDKLDASTMQGLVQRFDSWLNSEYMAQLQNESISVAIPTVFADVTGVGVFQGEFDSFEGKLVFKKKEGKRMIFVVILRLEEVDRWDIILKPMFADYTANVGRTGHFKVGGSNPATVKWYSDAYAEFKAIYRFSNQVVSELRQADLDSRFYSQSEWAGFEASAKGAEKA